MMLLIVLAVRYCSMLVSIGLVMALNVLAVVRCRSMLSSTVLAVCVDAMFVVDVGVGAGIAVAVEEIVDVAVAVVVAVESAVDSFAAGAVEKHSLHRLWNLTVCHLLTSERQHSKAGRRTL